MAAKRKGAAIGSVELISVRWRFWQAPPAGLKSTDRVFSCVLGDAETGGSR
jgi:hypothetical protein